ncbi:MAG: VOC family protein, partial [bacterium]|nr:VOC family protein [bacterium]
GGMMQLTPEFGDAPPHWMPYFQSSDCDASAAQVTALGGKVEVGPRDIPNVGRFAVLQDPQGAYFSVFQPAG